MMKKETYYKIVILLEDFKISEFIRKFDSESDLIKFAEEYLDGNNYIMNVYSMTGKKLHSFEYSIGSHNKMKLFDNVENL